MQTPTFSVSQFLDSLNQTLEYAYPIVQIEGEVASFKVNQNKYIFFDLKDETGTVNCFASIWQIKTPLEDGMKVLITARPKITAWGKFSLTIQAVKPIGDGALKRAQELIKTKLEKEGLFDSARKRLLPEAPRQIGVISSVNAAGYADFIKILSQRTGGMKVEVAQVQVQGEAAPAQIVRAIDHFNQASTELEVIVLVRGGGSLDDLSAWNDERVVRAIAGSRLPTLVGIGHETDTTLADLASDVRAATPSNAAQIVTPDRREIIASGWRLVQTMSRLASQQIEQTTQQIAQSLKSTHQRVMQILNDHRLELRHGQNSLALYDPQRVLERGYALVRGKLAKSQVVEIETASKLIKAEIINVTAKN